MRSISRRAKVRAAASLIALAALTLTLALPANAVNIPHSVVVSTNPAGFTPNIQNGRVNALLVMNNRVYVGGTFTTVRNAGSSANISRPYIFAFDQTTGTVDTGFQMNLSGAVEAIAPGPSGSIFVGGKFNQVGGATTYRRLLRVNAATGATITSFRSNPNDQVLDLAVRNGQLYVAGEFTTIGGASHSGMARLDTTTGNADPSFNVQFTDPYVAPPFPGRDPATPVMRVWKIDLTPDGSRLVATGNFRQVNGQKRDQIAILDTGSNPVGLTSWSTTFFQQTDPSAPDPTSIMAAWCIPAFAHYIRDIDISPDGSYFAAVTTGANWLHPACDSMSRWNLDRTGPNQDPEWVTNTGGDSFHSVLVTGAAIYGGGHQQFVNNPYNPNRCGFCINPYPGGVSRTGFSAHDPLNGLPFSWNPIRNPRGKGVLAMVSTADGFFFGSDTNRIAGETHQKLAFMPTQPGGITPPSTATGDLPGTFYTVNQSGNGDIVARSYDGNTFVGSTVVANTVDWSDVHGAFVLNGQLYTGRSNGTFTVRSFNGSTAGNATAMNLYGLENAPGPQYTIPGTATQIPGLAAVLSNVTGMAFDSGWIYYTVQGEGRLYARAFTQESGVVGAPLLVSSTSADGVAWGNVRGMTVADGNLYYALADGSLNRVAWSGGAWGRGHPTGSSAMIDNSIDWSSTGFFVI